MLRDIRSALEGIQVRKSIMIVDDNFTVDMKRAKDILKRMFIEKAAGNRVTCGMALKQSEGHLSSYVERLSSIEGRFYGEDGKLLKERLPENKPEECAI
ncbi:MAG: hypothetical protein AB2L14_37065 [Candidatus Xenobiia bacterium LiM19]